MYIIVFRIKQVGDLALLGKQGHIRTFPSKKNLIELFIKPFDPIAARGFLALTKPHALEWRDNDFEGLRKYITTGEQLTLEGLSVPIPCVAVSEEIFKTHPGYLVRDWYIYRGMLPNIPSAS